MRDLCSWCLGFFWLATNEMRQQDVSSHRYIYSSISVQLIDQCMLQAAVSREMSSASRINCCCCISRLYGCLPVSRLGVPTALEIGEKKPTRKKKRGGGGFHFHIQTWWEKKHQFLSFDPCHSYGFERQCYCLLASSLLIHKWCMSYPFLSMLCSITVTSPK